MKPDGRPNRCLADYVAPTGDHLGGFAVSIHGADELAARYEARARRLPRRSWSRRWPTGWPRRSPSGCTCGPAGSGSRPTSSSRRTDLHAERFRGIRPAFGYPACPDHSEKGKLFDLLGAARGRHRADRVVRDDAGGGGQRHLSPTRTRGTSPSAGSAATRSRTTRVEKASPCYKWSSGCGQICRRRPRSWHSSVAGAALADRPTVKLRAADQAQAEAALLRQSDFGAGWRGGKTATTDLMGPSCPGFDPKESDLVVSGHAEAGFTFSRSIVQFEQAVVVLRSAGSGARGLRPHDPPGPLRVHRVQPAQGQARRGRDRHPARRSRRPARTAPPTARSSSSAAPRGRAGL